MKRIILIILGSICLMLISGCAILESWFSPSESNSNNNNNNYNDNSDSNNNSSSGGSSSNNNVIQFSIVYDDETLNYKFANSSSISIEPKYKAGYTLEGFYTEKNGNGEQYLSYLGKSVTNGWAFSYMTTLYPFYKEVDYGYVYTSIVAYEETPKMYSYNIYNDPTSYFWTLNSKVVNLEYIYKVSISNPNIKMKLTGFADFRDEPTDLVLSLGSSEKVGQLAKETFPKTEEFKSESISSEITGKTIINNYNAGNRIYVGVFCKNFGHYGMVKNMYFQISFIK